MLFISLGRVGGPCIIKHNSLPKSRATMPPFPMHYTVNRIFALFYLVDAGILAIFNAMQGRLNSGLMSQSPLCMRTDS